jgi:DUF4097 and DUF4098 domain-containing protein YvlB
MARFGSWLEGAFFMEMQRTTAAGLALAACMASIAVAQSKKEYRYTVGPNANVTVETQYGSIAVKPGAVNQVVVAALPKSDKVDIDNFQQGNRIEIESHLLKGADAQTGRVDYELTVPPDATVSLRSSTGPLSASGLHGDLSLEGASASVDVRDVTSGHIHVKTLNGPVKVSGVQADHVEISSIDGEIHLAGVTGRKVDINSTGGKISFDGGFGNGNDYSFVTHTGDIEAFVPKDASADFRARSMHGQVENDFPLNPTQRPGTVVQNANSFIGSVGLAASKVVLQTFSGKIRLKRQR